MIAARSSSQVMWWWCFVVVAGLFLSARPVQSQSALDTERLENARKAVLVTEADYLDVLPLYTDDMIYQDPVVDLSGMQSFRSFLEQLWEFSPVYGLEIYDEVYDGNTGVYMAYWKMAGRNTVTLVRTIEVEYEALGMSIIKFRPGETLVYFQRDQYSEGDLWSGIPFPIGTVVGLLRGFYLNIVT